ncbi:TRAP transporter small permease [Azoarcus sp. L1K30]|uniref:TRAP transporter small permease n=1 Tax=Azoarcus sp. L1K30 TaxID=2820277 RepID=UPI001B84399C|nr:TRAP transporter small permease [Azoarcus sp. L1K30]MBR0565416.1 TRAP transporter small permease [Azoarcus sp. L1K30]
MSYLMALIRWLDRNAERTLILIAYASMALIIVYAVFERYVFSTQIPWSTSIPIYLFLWVAWVGCAYNVKKRTHLVFNDFRLRMPYAMQFAMMWLDTLLWIGFGSVVAWFTIEQTQLAYDNFSIVQGTDNVMQWWFYLATPVGWGILMIRALQNLIQDIGRFRRHEPFLVDIQTVGAD